LSYAYITRLARVVSKVSVQGISANNQERNKLFRIERSCFVAIASVFSTVISLCIAAAFTDVGYITVPWDICVNGVCMISAFAFGNRIFTAIFGCCIQALNKRAGISQESEIRKMALTSTTIISRTNLSSNSSNTNKVAATKQPLDDPLKDQTVEMKNISIGDHPAMVTSLSLRSDTQSKGDHPTPSAEILFHEKEQHTHIHEEKLDHNAPSTFHSVPENSPPAFSQSTDIDNDRHNNENHNDNDIHTEKRNSTAL